MEYKLDKNLLNYIQDSVKMHYKLDENIWKNLPNELIYHVTSFVPQGRHIFRGMKIPKKTVHKQTKNWVMEINTKMLSWFIENNNPPEKTRRKIAKFIFFSTSSELKSWGRYLSSRGYHYTPPKIEVFVRSLNFLQLADNPYGLKYSN
jgi:hypothetical protein